MNCRERCQRGIHPCDPDHRAVCTRRRKDCPLHCERNDVDPAAPDHWKHTFDADLNFIESSGAAMLGYDDDAILGTNGYKLLVIESREDIPTKWNPHDPDKVDFSCTVRLFARDRSTCWVRLDYTALVSDGIFQGYKSVARRICGGVPGTCCQNAPTPDT